MEVLHSCRCCLQRAPDMALTSPYTHLGITEVYSHMLEECFDLHVNALTVGNNLEAGICKVCVDRLRDASNFKLQVQHCQVELRALLLKILQVKEEELVLDSEMQDVNGTSKLPIPIPCGELPVKQEMEENYGNSSEEGREILHEELSMKSETWDGELSEEDVGLPAVEAASHLSPRAREQLAMACSVRLERLPSPTICLANSLPENHKPYTCNICDQQFKYLSSLRRHVKIQHKVTNYSLKKLDTEVICDICNKTIKSASIAAHKLIHTGEKPYACDTCDKQFRQLSTLNQHKRQHTGAKPYNCKICKKTFSRSTTVRKHERSHSMLKRYSCEECHKTFKERDYLQAHKRIIHSSETPLACDQCDARFKRKHSFILHLEMHTGKGRFSCGVCNKQFSYRNDLQRHVLTHTRKKPYSRNICDTKFAQKISLMKYKAVLAENRDIDGQQKLYACDMCKKQFIRRSTLISHIKSHMSQRD